MSLKGWYGELSDVNVIFFLFQGTRTYENHPFFKKIEIFIFDSQRRLSAIITPYKFTQCYSSKGCLFSSEKTCDVEC